MVTRKEDTARRQARRKEEGKNKEQRKEANGNFQTKIPRELYEEITAYLKDIGMTKVQFINFFSTREKNAALGKHLVISKRNYPKDSFYFKAESFFNAATYIEDIGVEVNYGGRSLHEQSHGERFLSLVQNRFCGKGLYILDEPESALSPQSQLLLLAEINYLVENDSQFIIATHSPILLSYPTSSIFNLSESGIHPIKYEDTDVYSLYRDFLNNPSRFLRHLL